MLPEKHFLKKIGNSFYAGEIVVRITNVSNIDRTADTESQNFVGSIGLVRVTSGEKPEPWRLELPITGTDEFIKIEIMNDEENWKPSPDERIKMNWSELTFSTQPNFFIMANKST